MIASTQPSQSRIPELDGLRGIAILLVLLYHFAAIPPGGSIQTAQSLAAIAWSGVDLFFVLSGFLIGGILMDARQSSRYFGTFYGRRICRIMPLYYFWVAAYLLIAIFHPGEETWRAVPVYTFFLQNSFKINHAALGTAWLGALWSLAVEEQFYLVVPFLIRWLPRRALLVVLLAAVAGAPLVRVFIHIHLGAHPAAQYTLTVCRADSLAMGVLLAMGWRNERFRDGVCSHRWILFLASFILLGTFLYLAVFEPSQYSLTMAEWGFSALDGFFGSLLLIAIAIPGGFWSGICRSRFLIGMGRISYCLYLVHDVVNFACHQLLRHSLPSFDSWTSAGTTMLAALLAFGLTRVSWVCLEGPLIRWAHRRYAY